MHPQNISTGFLDEINTGYISFLSFLWLLLTVLKYSLGLCFQAAVVLCMDVGFTMSNSFPGEESPFEQAKKVMTMFVQRQVSVRLALSLKLMFWLLVMQDVQPQCLGTWGVSFHRLLCKSSSHQRAAFFFSCFWPIHWIFQFLRETRGNVKSCLKVQSPEPDGLRLDPCSAMSFAELMLLNKSFNYFVPVLVTMAW